MPARRRYRLLSALLAPGIALLVTVSPARAEPEFPSAQDLLALVEVAAVHCVAGGHLTSGDVDQMRRNLPRHFHRATYAQYLASPAYARSAALLRAEIARDGITKTDCDRLTYFGRAEPNNLLFAERGLDYSSRPEREGAKP